MSRSISTIAPEAQAILYRGTDTKTREWKLAPGEKPEPVGTPTRLVPNVLLNAPKPPGISPGLMKQRPSLRVIFRVANRKKD